MEFRKSFVYDKGPEQNPKDGIPLTFSIFFDGTQNNKTSTEKGENHRENIIKQGNERYDRFLNPELEVDNSLDSELEPGEEIYYGSNIEEISVTAYKEKADSYENDYTNVARLWSAYDDKKEVHERIYIEGVGTYEHDPNNPLYKPEDDMFSATTGVFGASVRVKARRAATEIYKRLNKYKGKKTELNLTIDVFGFSRGAATARYFSHFITSLKKKEVSKYYENQKLPQEGVALWEQFKSLYSRWFSFMDKDSLSWAEKMQKIPTASAKMGLELKQLSSQLKTIIAQAYTTESHSYFQESLKEQGIRVKNITLRFAGLYDTVSSYGLLFDNDVKELSLDAVNKARHIVHLTAADEYRKNFCLTNIKSSGFRGIELSLPGAHSDVGGSYTREAYEKTAYHVAKVSFADHYARAAYERISGKDADSSYAMQWATEPSSLALFRQKLIKEGWLSYRQCEVRYQWWLSDSLQALTLAGIIQAVLGNFPSSTVNKYNKKSLVGLELKTMLLEKMPKLYSIPLSGAERIVRTAEGAPPFALLYGHRKLYNDYSFIPLDMMADFALEAGVPINKSYFQSQEWKVPQELSQVHSALKKYKNAIVNLREKYQDEQQKDKIEEQRRKTLIDKTVGVVEDVFITNKQKKYLKESQKISCLDYLSTPGLHKLRSNYLHWSAKSDSFGYDPITRSVKYENKRKIYEA